MPTFWVRSLVKSAAVFGGSVCLGFVYGAHNDVKAAKHQPWPFHEPSVVWDTNWDKREPESLLKVRPNESGDSGPTKEMLDKVKSKATRHLFLIRHGQYYMNNGNGDESKCLTPLGHKQADLTGLRLKELSHPYTVLIRSTMTRATETAAIISEILPEVPVVSCDMIREGAPIPPEPPVGHWRPEAQQFYEDGARIEAAFRKYFHRAEPSQTTDTYEIMVCHANVIRYFVCRALQFPPEAWLRLTLHNCSITWIVIHPSGRVVLKHLGDAGHIPADMLSTS